MQTEIIGRPFTHVGLRSGVATLSGEDDDLIEIFIGRMVVGQDGDAEFGQVLLVRDTGIDEKDDVQGHDDDHGQVDRLVLHEVRVREHRSPVDRGGKNGKATGERRQMTRPTLSELHVRLRSDLKHRRISSGD